LNKDLKQIKTLMWILGENSTGRECRDSVSCAFFILSLTSNSYYTLVILNY
jgi:hypothetical protein